MVNNGVYEGKKEVMDVRKKRVRNSDVLIRLFALALSLAATLLLGLDKQTKIVPITLVPTLPPLNVPVMAKWSHLSAFK